MKTWHWIAIGGGGVATTIALFTVLNKGWWARRINTKYKLVNLLTSESNFVRSQSLRSLMTLYYKGTFVDGTPAFASPDTEPPMQ